MKLTTQAGPHCVVAYLEDAQGPRLVAAPILQGQVAENPIVLARTRAEAESFLRAIRSLLDDMPNPQPPPDKSPKSGHGMVIVPKVCAPLTDDPEANAAAKAYAERLRNPPHCNGYHDDATGRRCDTYSGCRLPGCPVIR